LCRLYDLVLFLPLTLFFFVPESRRSVAFAFVSGGGHSSGLAVAVMFLASGGSSQATAALRYAAGHPAPSGQDSQFYSFPEKRDTAGKRRKKKDVAFPIQCTG
jgi:hypothetical protein